MQHHKLSHLFYNAIPRVPHDFFHIFTHPLCDVATAWCHIRLRSFHAVVSHALHSVSHTSHPSSLIVWPKMESLQRTTNPSIPLSCLVVFSSVKIIWSVRFPQSKLIHSPHFCWFDPFLISFRQRPPFCAAEGLYENRPHQRAHYISSIFISLFIPLSLQIASIIEHSFLSHSNSGYDVIVTIAISWCQWADIFEMFNHMNLYILHCRPKYCIGIYLPRTFRSIFTVDVSIILLFLYC